MFYVIGECFDRTSKDLKVNLHSTKVDNVTLWRHTYAVLTMAIKNQSEKRTKKQARKIEEKIIPLLFQFFQFFHKERLRK